MLFCGFASNYSAMESNKNEAGMNNEGTYVFGWFTTKLNCGWNWILKCGLEFGVTFILSFYFIADYFVFLDF